MRAVSWLTLAASTNRPVVTPFFSWVASSASVVPPDLHSAMKAATLGFDAAACSASGCSGATAQKLTPMIVSTISSPIAFLLMANALMLLVGCFMEALAAMLILIPILVPAAVSYGIDPVQFGVIMVLNLILGTIHPPIGVVLFVVTRIADVSFEKMSRAILPWIVPLLVVLLAITLWSPLTLWLPRFLTKS